MRYDLTILGNDEEAFETAIAANQQGLKTLVVVSESTISSWLETNALLNFATEILADENSHLVAPGHTTFPSRFLSFVRAELQDFSSSLRNKGIDVLNAEAEFCSAGQLTLRFPDFNRPVHINSPQIVIATGDARTAFLPATGRERRHPPHSFLDGVNLPERVRVIGGDDYGAALAACFQISGVDTQLVTRINCDSAALELATVCEVDIADHPDDFTASDDHREAQRTIDCRGRIGQTQALNLKNIKVEADEHGQLWCGRYFETWCRGVYGVGDVVGFSPDSTLPAVTQAEIVVSRILDREATVDCSMSKVGNSPKTHRF